MSEYDSLVDTLKDMGLVPKADSKEELESWMKEYVETRGLVPSVKVERSKVTADKTESLNTHPPRLVFSPVQVIKEKLHLIYGNMRSPVSYRIKLIQRKYYCRPSGDL